MGVFSLKGIGHLEASNKIQTFIFRMKTQSSAEVTLALGTF